MEMFLVGLVFLGLCEGTIYIAMIMLYDRDRLSIVIYSAIFCETVHANV